MSIADQQSQLILEFSRFKNWEDRYKLIIDKGRSLAPYPDEQRKENLKIKGCQSQVWLFSEEKDGKVLFQADSDALITKGLIALLLQVYSGTKAEEILKTPPDFIASLGLESKLSPSRSNGLFAMVKQIKLYAMAYAMRAGAL
jgi:cysteine desulfuration protein SufE